MLGHSPLSSRPLSTEWNVIATNIYNMVLSTTSSGSASVARTIAKLLTVQRTSYSTISGSNKANGSSAGTPLTTSSFTTVTGRLYIAHTLGSFTTSSIANGLGLTWSEINAGNTSMGRLWYAVCSAGATGTLSVTGGASGTGYNIDEFIGVDTTSPIVQNQMEGTGDATPTIAIPTLSAFDNSNNATYFFGIATGVTTNATSMTAEAGYSNVKAKTDYTSYAFGKASILSALNSGNDTTPTCTFAGSGQTGYGWGVELKAATTLSNGVANVASLIKSIAKRMSIWPKTTKIGPFISTILGHSYFTSTLTQTTWGGGNASWSNIQNAKTNDGTFATLTHTNNYSEDIMFKVSDLNLPNDAIITGIEANIEFRNRVAATELTVQFADGTTTPYYYGDWWYTNTTTDNIWYLAPSLGGAGITYALHGEQLLGSYWNTSGMTLNMYSYCPTGNASTDVDYVSLKVWYDDPTGPSKVISKVLTPVAITSSTSMLKNVAKFLSTSVSNVVSIIADFVSGSNVYNLLLETSSSSNSSIVRNVSKALLTSGSNTSSIIRSVTKALNNTVSNSTSIIKSIGKTLSTSVSNSTTFVAIKTVVLLLTTSASNSVSILRNVGKQISVSVSSNPTLARVISKLFSVVSSNVVSIHKIANKLLNVVSSNVATITMIKAVNLLLSTSASSIVSITKSVNKVLSTSASKTTTFTKNIAKSLNTSSSSVMSMIRTISKLIATSSVGTATLTAIASVIYYLTLATQSVSQSSIVRNVSKRLNTSVSNNPTIVKVINKVLNGVGVGNSSIIRAIDKLISAQTVSSLANVSKNVAKTFTVEASNVVIIVATFSSIIYNIMVYGKNWFYERLHKIDTTIQIEGPIATTIELDTPTQIATTVQIEGPIATTIEIDGYNQTTINIEV